MEVVHARCAGIDISKKDAKVCVRIAGGRKASETVTTWGSMTGQVLALRDHLAAEPCVSWSSGSRPVSVHDSGRHGSYGDILNSAEASPKAATDVALRDRITPGSTHTLGSIWRSTGDRRPLWW